MATKDKSPKAVKLDIRKEISNYLKYWYWFILTLIITLLGAYYYLKYTTPIYSAKTTIILQDETGSGAGSVVYSDLGLGTMASSNLTNEIGVLNSRRLMKEVVKALNLHITYFKEGKVRDVELYDNLPITVQVLRLDEAQLKKIGGQNFEISFSSGKFRIKNIKTGQTSLVQPGSPYNLGFADIVINPKPGNLNIKESESISIKFSDLDKVASKYRNKINLIQTTKSSGLMELELKDPVKEKARDILDQLVLEFNRNAMEDKNLIAGNTAKFINERLAIINGELDSVETNKEVFKEVNRLTDIQSQSQMFMQNANEYNKRQNELGTQLELSNAMLEFISSDEKMELLPTNLGISEPGVNQQLNEYNNLVLERNRILNGSSEKNPVVVRYNNQISQIRGNVVQSLQRMRSNLQINHDELNRQASSIGSQIYAVPSKEREFRGIERQQGIKETLYLFLLQKREENSLSLAVTEPRAKIVDRAFYSDGAVSPNSTNIYLGSFVLGLFIPFSFIYARNLLDNKVRRRSDIENISTEISVLGVIPKVNKKTSLICKNDRSVLAEAFRILITNLQYMLVSSRDKVGGKVILITSTIKGEGKTFTAMNIAITLANTGHKVILVGTDLRNPKLQPYSSNLHNNIGVSDYLFNDNLILEQLIEQSTLHPDVDILTSGTIPPNPYELLKHKKMDILFAQLEYQYEFIIVDTAPSMLVADTFMITQYADLILYLVRSGHTEKDLLEFPLVSQEEGKLQNVSFVLNGVKSGELGYGNKYGYGYGEEKKKFWQKPNNQKIAKPVTTL